MRYQMIIATFRTKGTPFESGDEREASVREPETEDEEAGPPIGWAYVGSHNFTPSAWGTLSGSVFNPTLNVSLSNSFSDKLWRAWL